MAKKRQNIAIFGASGHIGKNLSFYFSQEGKNNLFLFGRNRKKIEKIMHNIMPTQNYQICNYLDFCNLNFDVIINCIGIGNPNLLNKSEVIEFTEYYDNRILDYINNNKSTTYVNFSSGVVHGGDFTSPSSESTITELDISSTDDSYFYSISKIYSEAKHRFHSDFNIIDLRVYSFFSRFIDLNAKFLMSELLSALKYNTVFVTDETNVVRDYIHPIDLYQLIKKCIKIKKINQAYDVHSKKPVTKFKLLRLLSDKYNLEYIIQKKRISSPTGTKLNYYSKSKKISELKFEPKYSSIESIDTELEYLLDSNA